MTNKGSKIIYNRDTLIKLSKSPLSQGAAVLPVIPGVNASDNLESAPVKQPNSSKPVDKGEFKI